MTVVYNNEYQFFENHVLHDEVTFSDFYNALLDALKISEEAELKNVREPTKRSYSLFGFRKTPTTTAKMEVAMMTDMYFYLTLTSVTSNSDL